MPTGQYGYAAGAIADQTQLLQDIRSELAVYNSTADPWVDRLSEHTSRQTLRVAQAPKQFRQKADGGIANSSNVVYRLLNVPFKNYDLNSEFTVEYLQDALSSDIMAELAASVAGDVELVNALFFAAIFAKQTVGSIAMAYQAGFYNGELDVPSFKNNSFSAAHYHYTGFEHHHSGAEPHPEYADRHSGAWLWFAAWFALSVCEYGAERGAAQPFQHQRFELSASSNDGAA